MQLIKEAGVNEIWSTDCIPHPSNAVEMAPLVAAALLQNHTWETAHENTKRPQ
jgi:ribose-phosphate pyrophosphokinase